jgi:hypothetical protein
MPTGCLEVGRDQNVESHDLVDLDASQSLDLEYEPLTADWLRGCAVLVRSMMAASWPASGGLAGPVFASAWICAGGGAQRDSAREK